MSKVRVKLTLRNLTPDQARRVLAVFRAGDDITVGRAYRGETSITTGEDESIKARIEKEGE